LVVVVVRAEENSSQVVVEHDMEGADEQVMFEWVNLTLLNNNWVVMNSYCWHNTDFELESNHGAEWAILHCL